MQAEAGYPLLFAVASMVALVSLACTLRVGEPTLSETLRSDRSAPQEEFWQLLNSPRIRVPTIMLLLVGIAFGTLSTFVPLFIEETGVNFNAGLFYTAAAIASFSIRVLIGRASDRYGRGLFISISRSNDGYNIVWHARPSAFARPGFGRPLLAHGRSRPVFRLPCR